MNGAALDQLARAGIALEADLNGAGDSPAVLVDDGELLSTVNFDTTAMALAFEGLGLALSHVAAIAVFRIAKLMSPGFSGLPRFLTPKEGARTGFATVQKAASALEAEIRHLAPAARRHDRARCRRRGGLCADDTAVIEKTHDIVHRLARLAAIELVVAAQAVDLRSGLKLGRGTGRVFAVVRRHVPCWTRTGRPAPTSNVLPRPLPLARSRLRCAMSWALENYDLIAVALGEHVVLVGDGARDLAPDRASRSAS